MPRYVARSTLSLVTDNGTHILVELDEATLGELLKTMSERGRTVRICKGGEPVADLAPVKPRAQLPPEDPRLKVAFGEGYDPSAGLEDDDWPGESR